MKNCVKCADYYDNCVDMSHNLDVSLCYVMLFITTGIGFIKFQLVLDLHPTNSLVDALLQRKKSLENQLDKKQTIIELLLNKTNNITNVAHVVETMPENVNLNVKTTVALH